MTQQRYEYIRLILDWGDLSELNRLSGTGWRVVSVYPTEDVDVALLERILPEKGDVRRKKMPNERPTVLARKERELLELLCRLVRATVADLSPHEDTTELRDAEYEARTYWRLER